MTLYSTTVGMAMDDEADETWEYRGTDASGGYRIHVEFGDNGDVHLIAKIPNATSGGKATAARIAPAPSKGRHVDVIRYRWRCLATAAFQTAISAPPGEEFLTIGEAVRLEKEAEQKSAVRRYRFVLIAGRPPYKLARSAFALMIF